MCWYIFVRFVGHVTKLVPIRLGEPKEGQQHHKVLSTYLPINQPPTYAISIPRLRDGATRSGWTDSMY